MTSGKGEAEVTLTFPKNEAAEVAEYKVSVVTEAEVAQKKFEATYTQAAAEVVTPEEPEQPVVPEPVSIAIDFSTVTGSVQYATEDHTFGELTLHTESCHINQQLRIYSSSTNNGVVTSNALPGKIASINMNAGYKSDNLVVYGSNDAGATWDVVQKVGVGTSYKDYTVSFEGKEYNMFKLDVEGSNQLRIANMTVTYLK